ncbi:MAG: hypothetical protein ACYTFG_21010, partial [Planctomycetota bacterium]
MSKGQSRIEADRLFEGCKGSFEGGHPLFSPDELGPGEACEGLAEVCIQLGRGATEFDRLFARSDGAEIFRSRILSETFLRLPEQGPYQPVVLHGLNPMRCEGVGPVKVMEGLLEPSLRFSPIGGRGFPQSALNLGEGVVTGPPSGL